MSQSPSEVREEAKAFLKEKRAIYTKQEEQLLDDERWYELARDVKQRYANRFWIILVSDLLKMLFSVLYIIVTLLALEWSPLSILFWTGLVLFIGLQIVLIIKLIPTLKELRLMCETRIMLLLAEWGDIPIDRSEIKLLGERMAMRDSKFKKMEEGRLKELADKLHKQAKWMPLIGVVVGLYFLYETNRILFLEFESYPAGTAWQQVLALALVSGGIAIIWYIIAQGRKQGVVAEKLEKLAFEQT